MSTFYITVIVIKIITIIIITLLLKCAKDSLKKKMHTDII